jgi:hypothetical protein
MTLRPHNSPLPEGHPLRQGFVMFVRRPKADATSAQPDEAEDDAIGIRHELARRATTRAMFERAQRKPANESDTDA